MAKKLNIKKFRTKTVQAHIDRLGEPLIETLFVDEADVQTQNPLYLYIRSLIQQGYNVGTFYEDSYVGTDVMATFTELTYGIGSTNPYSEIQMAYSTGNRTYTYNFKASFNKDCGDRNRRTTWYICIFKNGSFGFKTKYKSFYSSGLSPFRVVIPQKTIRLTEDETVDLVNNLNISPLTDYVIGE